MSSRQEDKERRKRERKERELAEKAAAARRRRMQMVFGGGLAVAAVVAVLVVVGVVAFGGDDGEAEVPAGSASIPAVQETDLKAAADAAGCKLVEAPNEGAGHEEKDFKASDYQQNPPTSGSHHPTWYEDGVYGPGDVPQLGMLVHTLEHGRINVQYKPGTPASTVAQLETFLTESEDGYHMLLYENTTEMPFEVAATAWDQQIGCPKMNPKVFDALRAFRTAHIDKGPEVVP